MEIFGFIILVLITAYVTFGLIIISTQTLGQYNIGGVPTKPAGKILTVVGWLIVCYWWYTLFGISPFEIKTT